MNLTRTVRNLALLTASMLIATASTAGAARSAAKSAITGNHPAAVPAYWSAAADSKQIRLAAMLALRNTDELTRLESDLQNRHSPNYHKWLTPDQFIARFGPTSDQMAAVAGWLESQGFNVTATNIRTRMVRFTGTVATIQQAFGTSILTDGTSYANTSDPMLPTELAPTIQAVLGLTNVEVLSNAQAGSSSARMLANATRVKASSDAIVGGQGPNFGPADLYTFYNETPILNGGNKGTSAPDCVALPELGDVNADSLKMFTDQFKLPTIDLKKVLVNKTNPGLPSDYEPALDVEWVHAVSPNTPIIAYLANEHETSTPYLDAIQRAVDDNLCGALSSSVEDEDPCADIATIKAGSSVLEQAVMQGQTIFHSSGDFGANWKCGNVIPVEPIYEQSKCDMVPPTATGSQPSIDEEAASPFLTSVGGTQFKPIYNSAGDDVSVVTDNLEHTWNGHATAEPTPCPEKDASGGGKSQVFDKPDWQHGVNVPDDGVRDIPDIAMGASGKDPGFWVAGQTDKDSSPTFVATGGTSIASPMWGAISRLIAQSQGVTRLGNINQRLYELGNLQSASSGLHDITEGTNDNGGIQGYKADVGYDLVTGWGSPNIALLVAAFPGAALSSQTLSVTVKNGATATAGSFSIANTTPLPLQLKGIKVSITSPSVFSSVQVSATSGGSTQSAEASPSEQTVVKFPAPLVIAKGESAQVTVNVTAAGGHGSAAAGTLLDFGGHRPGPWTGGLLAILVLTGTVAAVGRRRNYAIAGIGACAVMAIAISSCGGSSSGGGSTPASKSTLSMAQGSVDVSDGEDGIVEVGGLPVTLSNVKVK